MKAMASGGIERGASVRVLALLAVTPSCWPFSFRLAIVRLAGHVVGSNGPASFAGALRAGPSSAAAVGEGPINVSGAEIFISIDGHGQKNAPGCVDDQIHTFPHGPESCNDACSPAQLATFAAQL